jgi:hypothetical protein
VEPAQVLAVDGVDLGGRIRGRGVTHRCLDDLAALSHHS